jgi:hypothetical protein
MGYFLNKLANLPVADDVSIYVFVINGQYKGKYFEAIERNFPDLARGLGDHGIIARGFDEEFSDEVCQRYLGKSIETMWNVLPAILVTDAHPDRITDKSMRLLIPIREAEERFGDLDVFFRGLAQFCRTRSAAFVEKLEQKDDWFDKADKVVKLSPGFMGMSVNLNEFVRRALGKPPKPA